MSVFCSGTNSTFSFGKFKIAAGLGHIALKKSRSSGSATPGQSFSSPLVVKAI